MTGITDRKSDLGQAVCNNSASKSEHAEPKLTKPGMIMNLLKVYQSRPKNPDLSLKAVSMEVILCFLSDSMNNELYGG